MIDYRLPEDMVLVVRACKANRTSHNGFVWPETGPVACDDWDPAPRCGGGLHGLLWGAQDYDNLIHHGLFQVVEVPVEQVVSFGGKCKFALGNVILTTDDRFEAFTFAHRWAPNGTVVHSVALTGGDDSTLTGGDRSTLTGGYHSTLTSGRWSTLTGGDYSTLTGGDGSTLTSGRWSTLTGGDYSTLTGGDHSTLTGGDGSTLAGGDYSTLTGGDGSTLTGGDDSILAGGDGSTLTGGYRSTLTAGDDSILTGGHRSTLTGGDDSILAGGDGSTLTGGRDSTLTGKRWDGTRWRLTTVYVGEDGIEANVPYRFVDGQFHVADI